MFRTAYDRSLSLKEEMDTHISAKNKEIEALQEEISSTLITQEENSKFMKNIENLI